LQDRFSAFLSRHRDVETAAEIVAAEKREIALYERHAAYIGYGFYLAKRIAG